MRREDAEEPETILTEAKKAMERELAKAKENAIAAIGRRNALRNELQERMKKARDPETDWVDTEIAKRLNVRERRPRDPDREPDFDDPEIAEAAAEAPPTDLESFADVRVELELNDGGKARLTLGGEKPLVGEWSLSSVEGRRGVLEIRVERTLVNDEMTYETRRFDIETLKPIDGEGFVLREQNADRRFGRLLFRRPGDDTPAAAISTKTTEASPETMP